jgi:glycosyltransferase involved in cell wall biosynthesis
LRGLQRRPRTRLLQGSGGNAVMLVSILTPSLNQRTWLADNLASVAAQTYPVIEHIVIDGGSTDGSVELLAGSESRSLVWESAPDRGQSHALNKALSKSSGHIIGWINADDGYVDRRAVQRVVQCFASNHEIDVVYGHSLTVGPENDVLQVLWAPPFISRLTEFVTPFYQPALFFRRPVLETGFVDESLHYVMDFDLWRRLWSRFRFQRISSFVGMERHQPGRKVYTAHYRRERADYFAAHLPQRDDFPNKVVRSGYVATERVMGMVSSERVRRSIDPAIELSWPPARRRVRTQFARDRAALGFE